MAHEIKKIQNRLILLFVVVILLFGGMVTVLITRRANTTLTRTVSSLIASNARQLELNIDSYLDEVEQSAALMFSDPAYYEFNPTDETMEEYDKIQGKNAISSRIVDLGLMKNFSDFGVVYQDDSNIGWISQVTQAMFPNGGIYEEFASGISDGRRADAWSFDHMGNQDRLYYTKRLNENAILVLSFYSLELENVFNYPETLSDMTIRLVNDRNQILFSSQEEEIGQDLPGEIYELVGDRHESTAVNDDFFATVNTCTNGWRVVCSIPAETILKDTRRVQQYAMIAVGLIALISILITRVLFNRVSMPVNELVSGLDEKASRDQLTGLLNKMTFENVAGEALDSRHKWKSRACVMVDLDDFKSVNDTLGHAAGDEVLRRTGHFLNSYFTETELIGRIGGDEFCMLFLNTDLGDEAAREHIHERLRGFYVLFEKEMTEAFPEHRITVSCGVTVTEEEIPFTDLYQRADKVLYSSKQNGKNQETFD